MATGYGPDGYFRMYVPDYACTPYRGTGEITDAVVQSSSSHYEGGCWNNEQASIFTRYRTECTKVSRNYDNTSIYDAWEADADGNEWRCGCRKLFAADGIGCETEPTGYWAYYVWNIVPFYATVWDFVLTVKGCHMLLVLVRSELAVSRSKRRMNSAIVTVFITTVCTFLALLLDSISQMRYFNIVDDRFWESSQILYGLWSVTTGMSVLGLALVWLKIAIISTIQGRAGKRRFKYIQAPIQVLMAGYGVIGLYLCVSGSVRRLQGPASRT